MTYCMEPAINYFFCRYQEQKWIKCSQQMITTDLFNKWKFFLILRNAITDRFLWYDWLAGMWSIRKSNTRSRTYHREPTCVLWNFFIISIAYYNLKCSGINAYEQCSNLLVRSNNTMIFLSRRKLWQRYWSPHLSYVFRHNAVSPVKAPIF